MQRRIIVMAVAAVSTLMIACADAPTAPTRSARPSSVSKDGNCLSGYTTSSGFVCTDTIP